MRQRFSKSKVREREKVEDSPVDKDCTVSHSEESPWVTQVKISPLPGVNLEEGVLSLQDARPAESH